MAESSRPSGQRDDIPEEDGDRVDESTALEADDLTPEGTELADPELADPDADVRVAADEQDAEELLDVDETEDDTPDKGDPADVEIADPDRLEVGTEAARAAKSTKPVKRNLTVAPVRKAAPTRKRDEAAVATAKRTTPVEFVRQSVGELKKVVWPTSTMLRQYFIVVLIFVLFIMFFVSGLDALFGWLLIQLLG